MKQQTRTCILCGISFLKHDAWLRRKYRTGIFCSRECAVLGRTRRPKTILSATCATCGIVFTYRKGCGGTHEYCSNPCRWKGHGRKCGGEKHPNWKGGISKRPWAVRTAIKRAKREQAACSRCGSTLKLHGHHLQSYSKHPELAAEKSNIEVICQDCHAKEHPSLAPMLLSPHVRRGNTWECVFCGSSYYRPSHISKTRFCSYACKNKFQKGKAPGSWLKNIGSVAPLAIQELSATPGSLTAAAKRNGVSKTQEAKKESHSSDKSIRGRGLLGMRLIKKSI